MAHVKKNPTGTYSVLWREKNPTGHVVFRQKTFRAKRAAERFARNTELALERGDATPAPRRAPTVRVLVETSLAASKSKLKPSTYSGYVFTYNNHVLPEFGDLPITALTPALVEEWVQGLAGKGLSPATIRNTFVALTKVCKYAIRHGYIAQNPCTGTPLPKATSPTDTFTGQVLTRAEVEDVAESLNAPLGLLLRFMAYTGLRAGEVAGLQIEDFDPLHGTVQVRRTVQRIQGRGWVATAPKTKRSARKLPILSSDLLGDMRTFLEAHPNRANPSATLWPGRKPGTHAVDYNRRLDPTNFLRWYFRPALKTRGLPEDFRLHDLRHTAASLWLAAGIEPYKVSRWLGHSNIAVTDSIYSHLYPTDYAAERAAFDEQAKPKPKAPVRRLAR
jgi:integrase